MRIAVLGWGSLIWNPGDLEIAGDWQTGGPPLPIEFSRISGNRRLTLVIDTQCGEFCITRYATSAFDNLEGAIENLRQRENTPNKDNIGFVNLSNGAQHSRDRDYNIVPTIQEWARENDFDAVIWTDLLPKFADIRKEPFTIKAAVEYLKNLPDESKRSAREYIRNAPSEVDTPVRRRLHEIDWLDEEE